jgi:hypothetical protein
MSDWRDGGLVRTRTQIAGVIPALDCYTRPGDRWNGFVTPRFEREAADAVAWATNEGIGRDQEQGLDPEENYLAWYDRDADAYGFCPLWASGTDEAKEYTDYYDGFDAVVDGRPVRLYAIGAWAWTWEDVRGDGAVDAQ